MKSFLARINAKQCTEVAQAARGAVRLQLRARQNEILEKPRREIILKKWPKKRATTRSGQ